MDTHAMQLRHRALHFVTLQSWLALGPKYGGSLGQLNVRKNCGLCGENVPAPPGTVGESTIAGMSLFAKPALLAAVSLCLCWP